MNIMVKLCSFALLTAFFADVTYADSTNSPMQAIWEAREQPRMQALKHEEAGEWRQAISCWEKWSPMERCIPGEVESEKTYHISICQVRLGETPAAVSNCLQAVFGSAPFANASVSLLLLKFYERSGQLPDLARMVDNSERRMMNDFRQKGYFEKQPATNWIRTLPTRPIRETLHIQELQSQKKIKELIDIAQDSSWTSTDLTDQTFVSPDWRCQMAANALAELGEPAVDAIEPISSEVERRKGNTSWLIYALGRSTATNALQALENGAKKEQGWNCINVVCAISMHGDKGHELLEKIAKEYEDGMQAKAQQFLANPKRAIALPGEIELPPMKRGSLPASYIEKEITK
jgi:hypothetical protein